MKVTIAQIGPRLDKHAAGLSAGGLDRDPNPPVATGGDLAMGLRGREPRGS
jgi:hypothetical protein